MRLRGHLVCLALVGVVAALVAPCSSTGAPADLDPSFSGDGKKTVGFSRQSSAGDLLVQPDGKIVLAGGVGPRSAASSRARAARTPRT